MEGGLGNDVYLFNRGDGADTLYDGFNAQGDQVYTFSFQRDVGVSQLETRMGSFTTSQTVTTVDGEGMESTYNVTDVHNGAVSVSQDSLETVSEIDSISITQTIESDGGSADVLEFGAGIGASDIRLHASGSDLLVGVASSVGQSFSDMSDIIRLQDWFDPNNRIETLRFADGSTFDLSGVTPSTSAGLENASLTGTAGSDILSGGVGHDRLEGGMGDDTLSGGVGTDVLEGGLGDDVYQFNRGDGADTIVDEYWFDQDRTGSYTYQMDELADYQATVTSGPYEWTGILQQSNTLMMTGTQTVQVSVQGDGGTNDVLEFGSGIAVTDLRIEASGNDLLVGIATDVSESLSGLTDVVRLRDWYNVDSRIESIRFNDGAVLNLTPILTGDDALSTIEDEKFIFSNTSLLRAY